MPTTHRAVIDFNADAISLSSSYSCRLNFSIGISNPNIPNTNLEVLIPTNLTKSEARCIVKSPGDDTITLGRPFFQAAYTYVDANGQIYLAQANQYNLGIQPQNFTASATLTPPPAPPSSPPIHNSATALTLTAPWSTIPIGASSSLTFLSLLVSFMAMCF
jgi:hypothetical protein